MLIGHQTGFALNQTCRKQVVAFSSQTLKWRPAGTAHRHVCERCTYLSRLSSAHCWPISLPLRRVIQLPAVIQIITFTHALSPSLSLSPVSLSLAIFSPPEVIENGRLSALGEAQHEKREEEHASPSDSWQLDTFPTAETSLWETLTFRGVSTRSDDDEDDCSFISSLFIHEMWDSAE